jgi:hypothetical protein
MWKLLLQKSTLKFFGSSTTARPDAHPHPVKNKISIRILLQKLEDHL